jgi:FixJ family two-component response regulator
MSVKAIKSGAVEFLTKPFRHQDLLDAVQRSLARDRIGREKQRNISELRQRYKHIKRPGARGDEPGRFRDA